MYGVLSNIMQTLFLLRKEGFSLFDIPSKRQNVQSPSKNVQHPIKNVQSTPKYVHRTPKNVHHTQKRHHPTFYLTIKNFDRKNELKNIEKVSEYCV